ncbi:MAG: ABC transporter permease [Muribaculaceae bacterium]|nr:ABC transporter permease [Muribaculaceae bacterium]
MNNLGLIIKREYMSIVGRKSFLVMTLLIPIIIVICMLIPVLLTKMNNESATETQQVTVIDETGSLAQAVKNTPAFNFVTLQGDENKPTDARQFYEKAGSSVDAIVVIPRDVLDKQQVTVYSENTVSPALLKHLEECLTDTLEGAKIAAYDVPELKKIMKDCEVELDVQSVKWDANGEENSSSTTAAMIFGIALSFITYMFVIMYGAMIMNSVIEEKTNRIVEVIVSSCTPFQLMMGKIIGVALVGLTQFAIWVLIIGAVVGITGLSVGGVGSDGIAAVLQAVGSINITYILICFVIYFIGGYLLYASLFAGFGSAVDQASDASQFSTPIIMIMIIALYAGMACMENPSGTMAMWCSIIPFTSPIVMMVRLPYGVPFLQLALSIVLLYATAAFMIWISSRIYRTGILLYGKKHSLKEIFKWIK